jgi:hypothetical protein
MTDDMLHDRRVEIDAIADPGQRAAAMREWESDALDARVAEEAAEPIQAVRDAIAEEIEDAADTLEVELLQALNDMTYDAITLDARCRLTGQRAEHWPEIAAYDALFAEVRSLQRILRQRALMPSEERHFRSLIQSAQEPVEDWENVPF